jgi:3-phenylpropionate/trans-cinnamate dioxygenase ferredoxin component
MTSICKQTDLPAGTVRAFQVEGRTVAVANVENGFFAFDDICTHLGCSLSQGSLEGIFITCPCHGSVFRVTDGKAVGGPAEMDVETHPLEIVDGEVLVSVMGETLAQDEAETSASVSEQISERGGAAKDAAADPGSKLQPARRA